MRNKGIFMTCMSFIICTALLTTTVIPAQAAEDKTYELYLSGATQTEHTMDISNYTVISVAEAEDLIALAENCGLDSWSTDKYVKLEKDINLSEHSNLMIPTFGGFFDGNGHTISGLHIDSVGSNLGLFRYIRQGAVVQNLTVSGNIYPQGSKSRVGILAGVNYGRILNCSVSGSIVGQDAVGGIAGSNEASGEIRRCSSQATVNGEHYVGGICGKNAGTLNNCSNSGKINAFSTEVTYHIEDISAENLDTINSTENVAAHTDTGGIAGYSEGKIYYCTNSGTVGYQHVGYNTGGIVGRLHQGYLQNCTNSGEVFGRKDVGGIAGQMEPFLEIQYLDDKLKEIDRETDKFLDLLDKTQRDFHNYGKQASDLTKSLTSSLKNASAAASFLMTTANDLWYIYNQELTGIANDMERLNQDLENQSNSDAENGNTTDHVISGEGENGDIVIRVPNDSESYRAALRRFADSTGDHIQNMTTASSDRSGGITENLQILNSEMSSANNALVQLSDVLEKGTDQSSENMNAVADQARVLRRLISELRDDLFRYEGITIEDTSDEAATEAEQEGEPGNPTALQEEAYYDTTTFQQGKITLCVNEGRIFADTNVGGIAGQIATELDFDPEDDVELTGEESFNLEQTVKAVVRESRNYGEITGKKDYVGGIVGKADHGAVISCEAYGDVSSTGGSYVGGIAGASGYAVRNCYFLGNISGKNQVGGIVGKGCDIFYSVAYPRLELTGEKGGSIAGQLSEDGILSGNYYVMGGIPGVDSIGFEGGATPLSYEELCNAVKVPDAFSNFTVTFRADGQELATFSCQYGDALDEAMIPDIPEKEGCYGVWPEFDYGFITGNSIIEAEYIPWISSIAGKETDSSGRPLILVQGNFKPRGELKYTENGEEKKLEIAYIDEEGQATGVYEGPLDVRIMCEDAEHTVIELSDGGVWKKADCESIGRYLEFHMNAPGTFRVTIVEDNSRTELLTIGVGVLGLLLLVFLFVKLIRWARARARRRGPGDGSVAHKKS